MGVKEAIMGSIQWWRNGHEARFNKMHDDVVAETEAVSQEAKALRNDVRRVARDDDAFDALITDMRRVHKSRKGAVYDQSPVS